MTDLYQQALTLPGCSVEERQALYFQAHQILHDELPWLWLFAPNVMYAESNAVMGWEPYAEYRYTNMADLSVAP